MRICEARESELHLPLSSNANFLVYVRFSLSLHLTDDDSHDLAHRQYMMSMLAHDAGLLGSRATRNTRSTAVSSGMIDPFRNFAQERQGGRAPALALTSTGSKPASVRQHEAKLSALFKPPDDLIYVGPMNDMSFDAALAHALKEHKWLLINIQQGDEFSSHQLNRDVWNEIHIHELVRKHFIFCQPNHNTTSGIRYRNLYQPPSIPTIAIIDPITKQRMWDAHEEGGRELRVDKKLIKHIEKTLKEFAARTDLSTAPVSSVGASASVTSPTTDDQLLAAAIKVSIAIMIVPCFCTAICHATAHCLLL